MYLYFLSQVRCLLINPTYKVYHKPYYLFIYELYLATIAFVAP